MKANLINFYKWFNKKFKPKSIHIDSSDKDVKVTLTMKKSDLRNLMKDEYHCVWCEWKGKAEEKDPDGSCPNCGSGTY